VHPPRPALRRALATLALVSVAVTGTLGAVASADAPGVLPRAAAAEATVVAVTSGADRALASGCDDGVAGTTLREALCTAAGVADAVVQVPDGTSTTLVAGPLVYAPVAAARLLLTSPGTFVVHGAGRRILDLDPGLVGGVDVTIAGAELRGGVPSAADAAVVGGGGAILAGSGDPGRPDALTLQRCVVADSANAAGPGDATAPGGAVQMSGGTLTIDGCTFTGNTADGAPGGAVAMLGMGADDSVRVSGSTFDGNTVTGGPGAGVLGGGALFVDGAALTVTGSVLTGSRVDSLSPSAARGAAVLATGTTTITGTRVEGSTVTGSGGPSEGGALWLTAGAVTASVLTGNVDGVTGSTRPASVVGPVPATASWWGCADACGAVGVTATEPRAVLTASAAPEQPRTGDVVTVTAAVGMSDGTTAPAALLGALSGRAVTWTATPATDPGTPEFALDAGGRVRYTFTRGAEAQVQVRATVDAVVGSTTLTQPVAPTVSTPADVSALEGDDAVFTATVTGTPAPTLQWQRSAAGSATWSDVAGATTGTLTVQADRALQGERYRLVASNSGGSVTSAAATLTVRWGPELTGSPADVLADVGETARFTVVAAGAPAPTVRWQTDAGSGWADVPGATDAVYEREVLDADDGLQVRAVVTGPGGSVTSDAATLTVRRSPVFTAQPADASVDEGGSVTFTAAAGGTPAPTLRWQSRTPGGAWTDLAGATSGTLQVVADRRDDSTEYRALASNASATDVPSATATLSVLWGPVLSDPADASVGEGDDARFTVTASGSPAPSLTWETSTDGLTWTPVAGVTRPELVLAATAADDGLRVRAVAASTLLAGPVTVTSAAATLAVVPLPEVVDTPDGVAPDGTFSARAGEPVTLSWVVDAEDATATWESSRDGGLSWGPVPAGARATQQPATAVRRVALLLAAAPTSGPTLHTLAYTPTAADDGLMLRLSVTNAAGTVTTDPVTLRVAPAAVVPGVPGATPGAPPVAGPATGSARAAGRGLGVTGADAAALSGLALALVLAGSAALVAARRRRA
jgi:hypothetical protein